MKKIAFLLLITIVRLTIPTKSLAVSVATDSGNIPNLTSASQSLTIKKSWIELNVVENGVTGTRIHISMEVHGYKGRNLNVTSFLDSPKGIPVKDTNGRYLNYEGNVCTFVELNNEPYDGTVWEDLVLFLPNDEIHPTPGEKEYFLHTFVFCDGNILGSIWSGSFTMKGPQQSSNNNVNNSHGSNMTPLQEVQEANRRLGNSIFYYRMCDICKGNKNCIYCNGHGRCDRCNGSNVCQVCHGNTKVYYNNVGWITCASCGGKGQCIWCQYTGRCICHRFKGTAGQCYKCEGQGMTKELRPQYSTGNATIGGGNTGSGSSNNSGNGKITCSSCGGSGKCRMCGGYGVSVGTDNYNCKTCYGTKKCPGCRGNGYY